MDTSGNQGPPGETAAEAERNSKAEGSSDEQPVEPRKEGEASGSRTVVAKPKGEGKVEQKSCSRLFSGRTRRCGTCPRRFGYTAGESASSPEADNMRKQTQTKAEKVRQEKRGQTRGPPFVWVCWRLIKSLQQRSNAVGAQTAQGPSGTASTSPNLRRGEILQNGQNVQNRREENHAGQSVA